MRNQLDSAVFILWEMKIRISINQTIKQFAWWVWAQVKCCHFFAPYKDADTETGPALEIWVCA